jgi:hypothetical protein
MSGWVAGAVVGGSLISGVMSSNASQNAASTQAAASDAAAAMQLQASREATAAQLQATRESIAAQQGAFNRQVELQAPFREAGLKGQNRLMDLLGISGDTKAAGYGSMATPYTTEDMYKDPGYAFRLNEGIKALDRSAAARGGLLSGAQLKAVNRYGQEYAANEYANAFNRQQLERASILNPLQSVAGQAQTSANTLTNAAGNLGAGEAAALMAGGNAMAANTIGAGNAGAAGLIGAGNARASGYIGSANAFNSALQGATGGFINYQQQQQQNALLNRYLGGGGGASIPPVTHRSSYWGG